MRFCIMAYKDSETEKFNPPFLVPMVLEDVIESIIDGAKKGSIEGAKYFTAYHLGYYDTKDASFELNKEPVKVAELSQYVQQ